MICLRRPYLFKYFKGYLPQNLLSPLLNTLSHLKFNNKVYWAYNHYHQNYIVNQNNWRENYICLIWVQNREAVISRCFAKKLFWELRKIRRKTPECDSFFSKVADLHSACNFIKKETSALVRRRFHSLQIRKYSCTLHF